MCTDQFSALSSVRSTYSVLKFAVIYAKFDVKQLEKANLLATLNWEVKSVNQKHPASTKHPRTSKR